MTRKRRLLAILAVVSLITLAVTGIIFAGVPGQDGSDNPRDLTDDLVDSVNPKDGDDIVLATVNVLDFTARDARLGYELKLAEDPSLTKDAAIQATILYSIDEVLIVSIAQQRNITATDAEARVVMARERAVCETDSVIRAMCTDHQEHLGYDDPDVFWEATVVGYQSDLVRMKTIQALHDDYDLTPEGAADNSDIPVINLKLLGSQRANATIVWNDEDMERLYEAAEAERAK